MIRLRSFLSIRRGFTLLEMLIVVVIIGILSVGLMPRLTGYLAKTRDLKRLTDLRNIAAAVEMYKSYHGELPLREVDDPSFNCNHWLYNCKEMAQKGWYATALSKSLSPYIKEIPRDPNKKIQNNIEWRSPLYHSENEYQKSFWNYRHKDGEYVYMHVSKGEENDGYHIKYSDAAVLIAKVETPEAANYIITRRFPLDSAWNEDWRVIRTEHDFGFAHIEHSGASYDIKKISLCDTIEKSQEGTATATKVNGKWGCKYTSEDQLYHVLKIE